ncbi:sensor domain-containing diguanylate cyclase [Gilvimarinus agarilyticus]|uniref:sensor domain-containing diguanylate cyclase n=1 Tax=Gilvimarinus agarilyticus TaxID=679259 RepID=UPI000698920F|nr:sensor domain-containing diguanylate cyclase [Gilvimarinus agarilyticus]
MHTQANPAVASPSVVFDRTLLKAIQEASPDAILVVDGQGLVVSFNQRFLDTWQIANDYVAEHQRADGTIVEETLLAPAQSLLKSPEPFLARLAQLYASPTEADLCEIELTDGRVLERHSVGLQSDDGQYLGRVWFFRDITSHRLLESSLRHIACVDTLTGEMNRRHFLECAAAEFTRAREQQYPLAILMIDLDHFKKVNDCYGHAAGDYVLEATCQRWRKILRGDDLLGRVGGEEFAILLPRSDMVATETVAHRLRQSITGKPFKSDGHEIFCSISGGMTMLRATDENIKDVLLRADDALYRAKRAGRDCIEIL